MVSRAIRLCGTETVDPPMRKLRAGPLSAQFDNGALRYIRIGDVEVLRGIAFLVRDENWGTFSPTISDLRIDERADGFSVSYDAVCADAQRELFYRATIRGGSDGSLSFEAEAEPRTDVLTNRTGFIVLHPIEGVSGRPLRVQHVDGSVETSTFPEVIDPKCPFKDVRALSHEFAPGVWARCTMEGDAYEMEDQRNWSDASYKTYIRPLTKPWPYTLPKGETIRQSVRLDIEGRLPAAASGGATAPVAIRIGSEATTLPAIGLGVPAEEAAHALERTDLLQRLGPKWLCCEFDRRREHGAADMERYRTLAAAIGASVTLEVITLGSLDPDAELGAVAAAASAAGLKPEAVTAFPMQELKSYQPGAQWPEMASFERTCAAARKAFPEARIGGGMAAYFTELNRKRPPAGPLDFVTHTTCPNVHAADDISVMETNEAIPSIILSTRSFMGERPGYRIGPSQLGCRENPYGKATTPNPDNRRVCLSRIDPRQRGLFNAAWMLAYLAACARGGLEAVAFGAPTGPFGHIYRRTDFAQPYFDDTDRAILYPGFHLLAGLAPLSGAPLLETRLSRRGSVEALAMREGSGTTLWVANLTPETVEVELPEPGARVALLDAEGFESLTGDPGHLDATERDNPGTRLGLDAYAVARVRLA